MGPAGQRFMAPVTLTLIPSAIDIYTLQFDLAVTNLTGPPVAPTFTFQSMLERPDPAAQLGFYTAYPARHGEQQHESLSSSLLFHKFQPRAAGKLGWVERPPETNLYPTPSQTLITYSRPMIRSFSIRAKKSSSEAIRLSFRQMQSAVKRIKSTRGTVRRHPTASRLRCLSKRLQTAHSAGADYQLPKNCDGRFRAIFGWRRRSVPLV